MVKFWRSQLTVTSHVVRSQYCGISGLVKSVVSTFLISLMCYKFSPIFKDLQLPLLKYLQKQEELLFKNEIYKNLPQPMFFFPNNHVQTTPTLFFDPRLCLHHKQYITARRQYFYLFITQIKPVKK